MAAFCDFPYGRDVAKTREWLDENGFKGKFIGWEADALLDTGRRVILSKFPLPGERERAEMLLGFLKTARDLRGKCNVILCNYVIRFL